MTDQEQTPITEDQAAISTGEDRVDPADEASNRHQIEDAAVSAAEAEADVHLPDMDDNQLEQVQKAVADKIRQRRESSRQADLNTIHGLIAKHGFKASEVRVPKETKGTKVAAKYRNPANAAETWTGRGKPPAWIAGVSKEDRAQYLIEA